MGSDQTYVEGWALVVCSIIFLFGAFIFNGVIIGVITNFIDRRVRSHQEGHIHYLNSGHYIIMGYDDMVPSIISHVLADKKAYVLLLTSMNAMELREKLLKSFSVKQMERVIINYGHRTSIETYKDIHLESAEKVYIVGNHENPAHDAINVECVDAICQYLSRPNVKDTPTRITCVFKDLDTYAAFKTSEIFKRVGELGMEFVPYNFFTGWAKQVFVKRKYRDFDFPEPEFDYPAVYGKGITPEDERYVHLVFVGTTNFAVAFAMEAAHVLHFPNADKVKTRITFIDKNADKEKDEFIIRNRHFFEVQSYYYRDLSEMTEKDAWVTPYEKQKQGKPIGDYLRFSGKDANFLDVEFEFIKGDVFSKNVQDEVSGWAKEHGEKQYLSIFLALADQRQNFVLGMNMPDEVYDHEVPVFIRQDRSDNFVTDLRRADRREKETDRLPYTKVKENGELDEKKRHARYANIYPFGMNETAYSADEHSLKRAKLINYLYSTMPSEHQFQGILALDAMPAEKIWEEADEKWKELSVALKWSNLYSAYAIRTKLATLRAMRGLDIDDTSHDCDMLTDDEVKVLALVEHNRWNVEKLLMGYRKARKEEDKYEHEDIQDQLKRNKKLFIHHDIRPFEALDGIKKLDEEFSRYIPWIMRMTEKNV
ncbi:MAG: hypothetical protein IJP75_07840 [Bacteroidaceae bacterium]|nr:hypothetical protein [Bacteroidaceae bacterium]